ncbi:MAG: hypothetical protein AB2693_31335, partial [Candidatus Thiodiazotropha sp.]
MTKEKPFQIQCYFFFNYFPGVSITELASIVKYIYSGKLLVDTDSIAATLQVCETLELGGVIEAYKGTLARKPPETNVVNASRNVDALESINYISSDEEQDLYSQTTHKQTTGLYESEVIDLSTEDDGFEWEIQKSSEAHHLTNQNDKTAKNSSSSNVSGALQGAMYKYPNGTPAVSGEQILEYKDDEATVPNKDSKDVDNILSPAEDIETILYSSTVQPKEKQVSFGESHMRVCGTTNVTRGRIMSIPSTLKKIKKSAMSGHSSHYGMNDSPKEQKIISISDEAGHDHSDKECISKTCRRTVRSISVTSRDNLRVSIAKPASVSQCDRAAIGDSGTRLSATCLCSSTTAVVPINIYKNISSVEGASLHNREPEILQSLHTGINKPVIEKRFINKEHRVAHSDGEQLRFPSQLTVRAIESDTKATDSVDSGTVSCTSLINQDELVFKASADNRPLESPRKNLNSEGYSQCEKRTEHDNMTVYMDDSCTITETCEEMEVDGKNSAVKQSRFVYENEDISGYDKGPKETLPAIEFSEKSSKSISDMPGERKRKVGTESEPVVRLRKLTKHEIMSWSKNKSQVRDFVKKVSFPRIRLLERGNTNEPLRKRRKKRDLTSKSLLSSHEVADTMFCRRFLGHKYVPKCTTCNMTFGTVHELHQHFAEDIHRNKKQVDGVSEQMSCSICQTKFQMAQLLD